MSEGVGRVRAGAYQGWRIVEGEEEEERMGAREPGLGEILRGLRAMARAKRARIYICACVCVYVYACARESFSACV